jgi:hypothetical protein
MPGNGDSHRGPDAGQREGSGHMAPQPAPASTRASQDAATPVLHAPAPVHDCVFAQACTPTTPGLVPQALVIASLDTPRSPQPWPAEIIRGIDDRAPPLPPPNA